MIKNMRIDRDKLKEILLDYLTEESSEEVIKRLDDEDNDEDNDEEDLLQVKEDKRDNSRGY